MGRIGRQVGAVAAALIAACSLAAVAGPAAAAPDTASRGTPSQQPADLDPATLRAGTAPTVAVDVGSDQLVVDLEPVESAAPGFATWDGEVVGDPGSSATVVRQGDEVAGLVTASSGTYRVRADGTGEPVVDEVTRTFPEGQTDTAAVPEPASTNAEPESQADVPTYPVIDVLVAYTPAALARAGGTGPMATEIALAVSSTNTAYADSGVTGRIRLAGTTALNENLDLSEQSLKWLREDDDGHVDQIHAVRTSTGADLVTVLTDVGGACGRGFVLNGLTEPAFRSTYGFATVDYPCAVNNLSFAHELGHNMGLNHDRANPQSPSPYDYGVGYVNVPGRWRTIMAYNTICEQQTPAVNCVRLRRFSNPDQTHEGAPLGRPWNGPDPADERRALNNTQAFVASWRAKPTPFTSWTRFVAQQYRDLVGRAPSSSETASAITALTNGSTTPQAFIEYLLNGTFGSRYAPVARLYYAYFVRPPDPGGLDYWVRKYRGGMKLSAISSNFAASSEFRSKYGTLSNRAFVNTIYVNLFERTGDPSGVTYWTGKLDRRERTRGQVMIGFSESSEFKRVRAEEISTVLLYRALLQRSATASQFASQVARLQGGTTVQRLILEVVDSAEYAGRVTT